MEDLKGIHLTPESVEYTLNTPLTKRKALGQYMTPPVLGQALANQLHIENGYKILDPAVGTGELLLTTLRKKGIENLELHGWDADPEILKITQKVVPTAHLKNHSLFTTPETQWHGYFDLIIGNPPYFELKSKNFNSKDFQVASGRTNIYSLFFERYLPLVKDGGHLAYIVPPSMNAGAYFANLRTYILTNSQVEKIELVRANSHFTDALTSVQYVILKKVSKPVSHQTNPYVVDFRTLSNNPLAPVIFTDNRALIETTWKNKHSIYDYGFEVTTGSIPWNEHKQALTENPTPTSSILYYAKDISADNKIKLNELMNKKRYLTSTKTPITGEAIIVNRIVGSLEAPRLKAALIPNGTYYGENHVNVIRARAGVEQKISLQELFTKLTTQTGLSQYLQALTGNTQLSSKELMNLIPL